MTTHSRRGGGAALAAAMLAVGALSACAADPAPAPEPTADPTAGVPGAEFSQELHDLLMTELTEPRLSVAAI